MNDVVWFRFVGEGNLDEPLGCHSDGTVGDVEPGGGCLVGPRMHPASQQ